MKPKSINFDLSRVTTIMSSFNYHSLTLTTMTITYESIFGTKQQYQNHNNKNNFPSETPKKS